MIHICRSPMVMLTFDRAEVAELFKADQNISLITDQGAVQPRGCPRDRFQTLPRHISW